ncbi:TIGR03905 family TSCPD domain-containing protein [Intestinibacter sp.]|uniref:TIGR03905 family TSCPD domain-containing protein n=1 Tax=Intestinibacter sp. TaxID=1965304 RepID=UPI003F1555AD
MYRYYTKGVCAKSILMDIEDDVLLDVVFEGGCEGALIAIKNLVKGKNIDYIIDTLEQIPCRSKGSSCPDQLANALKIYREFVYKKQ